LSGDSAMYPPRMSAAFSAINRTGGGHWQRAEQIREMERCTLRFR